MKRYLSVILAMLLIFTLAACGVKKDNADGGADSDKTTGQSVQQVTELFTYSGKKESVEVLVGFYVDGRLDRGYSYDSNGNMILDINYMEDGSTEKEKEEWLYDDANRLIKESYTDNYSSYSTRTTDYTYEGTRLIKAVKSDGSRTEYKTDDYGNVTEEQNILADGAKAGRTVYEYDVYGNTTLRAVYKADGSFDYEYRYEYDEAGNVKVETCSRSDGTESKTLREYNTDGKLLKYERFDNGVRIRDYGYEYDENGSMTKYYEYIYGESTAKVYETYYINDADGARTRYDKFEDGVLTEYCTYENDAKGRRVGFNRFSADGTFLYGEEISYTDSGLRSKRILTSPEKTQTVDYEYKLIEVPVERAQWVRDYQTEYDP